MSPTSQKTNPRVRWVAEELGAYEELGWPDAADFERLRCQIAQLAIEALRSASHPLAEQLEELRDLIDQTADAARKAIKVKPASKLDAKQQQEVQRARAWAERISAVSGGDLPHLLYAPQPGAFGPPWRRYWCLQLLLYTTGDCCVRHRRALAEVLGTSEARIRQTLAATKLERTDEKDAQGNLIMKRRNFGVAAWSRQQHLRYLRIAVSRLDVPVDNTLHLDGRTLNQDGKQVRLSPTQAKFLRILMDNQGECVGPDAFRAEGVNHPGNMKYELQKKTSGFEIPIEPCGDGGYALRSP